jgi:hypothetical protein
VPIHDFGLRLVDGELGQRLIGGEFYLPKRLPIGAMLARR